MDALRRGLSANGRSIELHGRWQEYLKIAVVNLALTIVTLGIYRFWAQARTASRSEGPPNAYACPQTSGTINRYW